MYKIAEGAFVTAERVGGIEVHLTLAADRTEVPLVEGKGLSEGCSAAAAGIGGLQALRKIETGEADWNPREPAKRLLAKSTLIWENQVEESRGKLLGAGQNRPPAPRERRKEMCSRETREDSPPLNQEYTIGSTTFFRKPPENCPRRRTE
jgi:hypothetical protein